MTKIGIFFGTDTGNTRRVAKEIHSLLGSSIAAKPVNIRMASVEDLLQYELLIIGSPTYAEGQLPGLSTGNATESWEEFLPKLTGYDFSNKKIALYGLGNQKTYPDFFVDALYYIYCAFENCNASFIGDWSCEGYKFNHSKAIIDDRFIGLVLDQENQKDQTSTRLQTWLNELAQHW